MNNFIVMKHLGNVLEFKDGEVLIKKGLTDKLIRIKEDLIKRIDIKHINNLTSYEYVFYGQEDNVLFTYSCSELLLMNEDFSRYIDDNLIKIKQRY